MKKEDYSVPKIMHRLNGWDYIALGEWGISYNDVFSMEYFYHILHEWVLDNGYAKRGDDQNFPEIQYIERVAQNGSKEHWIRWRLEKGGRDKKLFDFVMDFDIHTSGLKETDMNVKGKKIKANKGTVDVRVTPMLVVKLDKYFGKTPILKDLKKLLKTKVFGKWTEENRLGLLDESRRLQEFIRNYFRMAPLLPEEELGFYKTKEMV